ncbi:hypothetical protein V6N13_068219 [Hibiscus sabdariffa]|uniref:Uncharacterized protein n=1 Tax=Hibiscus sabdariffa TaxID=183260 RepID=A0ABR2ALG7_9ROSI
MEGDNASIASDVPKLIIVRPRKDLAAETAHEPYACMGIVFGSWRGGDGIGGGVELREHEHEHEQEWAVERTFIDHGTALFHHHGTRTGRRHDRELDLEWRKLELPPKGDPRTREWANHGHHFRVSRATRRRRVDQKELDRAFTNTSSFVRRSIFKKRENSKRARGNGRV